MIKVVYEKDDEEFDVVNALRFYYFGRAFNVFNSSLKLLKKRQKLLEIIVELENDDFIKSAKLSKLSDSIATIIYDKVRNVEAEIEAKKFKLPFSFNLIKRKNTRGY